MTDLLTRSFATELEATGRNLEGLCFRYNHPSRVSDPGAGPYLEAFTQSVSEGLSRSALHFSHPFAPGSNADPTPLGVVEYSDGGEGLAFRATVSDTQRGNDFLTLLADGALNRGVSIGFKPVSSRNSGGVTYRDAIAIMELSLLPLHATAAHEGAEILAVRNALLTPRLDAVNRRQRIYAVCSNPTNLG